ncbi:MAG: serine carboxypeptidase family protein, partial [Caulobacteraceae bacterium]|nr:serine carboxypeptidase family protein [Caulobacteraceae bacterium]
MLRALTTIKKRGRDAAMLRTLTLILGPLLLIWQGPALAQTAPQGAAIPYAERFVTTHQGVFNGQKMTYTATIESTALKDAAGRPTINFVSTAYVRRNVKDLAARPVIFVWGGGPSGPSTGLQMRLLGPRLSTIPVIGQEKGFTSTLVDNPQSVLDVADLVFVDPAETGFTRVLAGGRRADFYSVDGDAKSIADFIGAWLKANG